jgi:hypothetical protein
MPKTTSSKKSLLLAVAVPQHMKTHQMHRLAHLASVHHSYHQLPHCLHRTLHASLHRPSQAESNLCQVHRHHLLSITILVSTQDRQTAACALHAIQTWTPRLETAAELAPTPLEALRAIAARVQAARDLTTTATLALVAILGLNPAEDLVHHLQVPFLAMMARAITLQMAPAVNLADALVRPKVHHRLAMVTRVMISTHQAKNP